MLLRDRTAMISKLVALVLLCMLVIPINFVNAKSPFSDQQKVLVPVVLDGVYYQPEEFNKINQQLHEQGISLYFTTDNGTLYAFSSLNDFCKKYSIYFDMTGESIGSIHVNPISPLSMDPGYAYNWVNGYQGGDCLAIQEGWYGNLATEWRDVISSEYYTSGGSSYWIAYALCDQLNQGGNWYVIWKGSGCNDLRNVGFNDKAKSVTFGHLN